MTNDRPRAGDWVILVGIPPGLLSDLPEEDVQAIRRAIGTRVLLVGYDDDGRAELEFVGRDGNTHWIWVDQVYISATT